LQTRSEAAYPRLSPRVGHEFVTSATGQKQARAQTGPAELDGTGLTANVFLLTTLWGPAGHDRDSLMGYFRRVAPIGSSSWPDTKGRWTAFGNIGG
jgi:hypothetical protein